MLATYHTEIGIPTGVALPAGPISLTYTKHALRAAREDRYGNFIPYLPTTLDPAIVTVVEATAEDNRLVKAVVRFSANAKYDLSLVIKPEGGVWKVITAWANVFDDHHATLRVDQYAIPSSPFGELHEQYRQVIRNESLARSQQEEDRIIAWLFQPTHSGKEWVMDRERLVKFLAGDQARADRVIHVFA